MHAADRVKTMKKAEIVKSLTSNNKHNTIHRSEQPASQPTIHFISFIHQNVLNQQPSIYSKQ